MAAPYNDILSKLEAAMKTVLDALALTGTRGTDTAAVVSILTGLDDDAALLPRVTVHAIETQSEEVRDSGIFNVKVQVHIHSHSADETLATHRTRVATVIDAIMQTDRADVLSAAVTDFHCYDLQDLGPGAEPTGRAFHTIREFNAVCCPMTLT